MTYVYKDIHLDWIQSSKVQGFATSQIFNIGHIQAGQAFPGCTRTKIPTGEEAVQNLYPHTCSAVFP